MPTAAHRRAQPRAIVDVFMLSESPVLQLGARVPMARRCAHSRAGRPSSAHLGVGRHAHARASAGVSGACGSSDRTLVGGYQALRRTACRGVDASQCAGSDARDARRIAIGSGGAPILAAGRRVRSQSVLARRDPERDQIHPRESGAGRTVRAARSMEMVEPLRTCWAAFRATVDRHSAPPRCDRSAVEATSWLPSRTRETMPPAEDSGGHAERAPPTRGRNLPIFMVVLFGVT